MGLILFGLLTVAAAFAGARFTRWHPLAIATLGALVWGWFGALGAAYFSSGEWMVIGVATFVVGLFPTGLGAFLGWLRRKHMERKAS